MTSSDRKTSRRYAMLSSEIKLLYLLQISNTVESDRSFGDCESLQEITTVFK
ncbi:MAG: hypothetical protein V7K77_07580 [Nostoc sp.]|uniref:hypothetical protein n=1 Tax=Nostoc sp. TaxID=1180 RepID=UPI002FF6E87F